MLPSVNLLVCIVRRKHGSDERTCRCFAVDMQRGEAWQTTGSDTAMLKSDCQVPHSHDETWLVLLFVNK